MNSIRIFKLFISAFLTVCIAFNFVACATSQSNLEDIFSQLLISDESETEAPDFTEHIYVIIPNGCSGELSVKVRELVDGIREKTGILTSLKYDNELTVTPKNSCEVLVGNTNRLVSENAMDVLRKDEYLCRRDDGAIVICGRSDASTVIAIDKFISNFLPLASNLSLLPEDAEFEYSVDYEIDRISLNGYDLYDYVFVYPNRNQSGEKEIATMLRDFINARSGYYLEVISDVEISARTGRIISLYGIGANNVIAPCENGVALEGVDSYSLSLVAAEFIKMFKASENEGTVDLKFNSNIELSSIDTKFKSAFYFLKENKQVPFEPVYNLIALLKSEHMGICFIGNPNDDMRADFELNIKAPIITQEVEIGERRIMIAYNSQLIKRISVTVDADNMRFFTELETSFGEKLSYIYIIDGEIPKMDRNAIAFAENCKEGEYENSFCVSKGSFEIEDDSFDYMLSSGENILYGDSEPKIIDDENQFSCIFESKVRYADSFLKDTLK